MEKSRRKFISGAAAAAALPVAASAQEAPKRKVHRKSATPPAKPPLFNSAVSYGNLLFIAGKGAHYEGDIKAHTKTVLDDIQKELENAGSSMDKVLKCNVYLKKMDDYKPMNEVFQGRFGAEPPVRTTIVALDLPGNSLVEIDVIAFI
ncbi:MAG: RidA family protein [Candidatus Solibacter usitatus]|nr:RidA family protein [Acidobacteriota bacterium]MBI5281615.1 RidA family protein [Candidatus Solibacter usitatus]